MVDIAVGSVTKIIQLVSKIREAAVTAHHNKDVCLQITRRVNRLGAILLSLEGNTAKTVFFTATSAMLFELEETLCRALTLIRICQEKKFISRLFTSNSISRQLHQVNQDISDRLIDANFATGVQFTIKFATYFQDGLPHPTPPQDAGASGSSGTSGDYDSINICMEISFAPEFTPTSSSSFSNFRYSEMVAATDNFSEQNLIARGGCATVYKGVLPGGRKVAIKIPHGHYDLVLPVRLQHENIVGYIGECHYDLIVMVVEEYMPKGTLSQIINGSSQQLDWPSMFQIIRRITQGVAYLQTMWVVHSDLKPDNILFDYDMNPKIYGFERSRLLLEEGDNKIVTEELLGTMGNMPPEYIADGIISMKSDVFSFGVLLLRIISWMGDQVQKQHPISWAWEVREVQPMRELFHPSLCDESQVKEIERCIKIALLCTQMEPADRPTMSNVLKMLNGKEKLSTPKRPVVFKNKNSRVSKEEEEEEAV